MCGLVFKIYLNSMLSALAINIAVNSCIDLLVVRPVGFFILSVPLRFNLRIQIHIQH